MIKNDENNEQNMNLIGEKTLSNIQQKSIEQANLNTELKNTNNSLLGKLVNNF